MPRMGQKGWRVDPSPAAKNELEQKKAPRGKKAIIERQGAKQRGESGCSSHESQLLTSTLCAIFHC